MENQINKQEKIRNIRNFVIISHIDHGKSTLADRFLELTKTIPGREMRPQFLDSMDLEREKGITIKMHPCKMLYRAKDGKEYILNLIDTPGHIDFYYETSRALACVEGAILLVDAQKGIQAQTIFNLEMAKRQGLKIIGVVNKIDLADAEIEKTRNELAKILGTTEEEIFLISAKEGTNVKKLLESAIKEFPAPKENNGTETKALIFDSKYDSFSGVIAYVRIFQGSIKKGDKIYLLGQKVQAVAKEIGFFLPGLEETQVLFSGEVGYIKTNIKEPGLVMVGDTISLSQNASLLPGYKKSSPVIFLTVYPREANEFSALKESLEKLKLTDPSFTYQLESSSLGRGIRIGFLGSLQAEIILKRLRNEYNLDLISTAPQTIFKITTKNGKELVVSSPEKWPDASLISETLELFAGVEIVSPDKFFGQIFKLFKNREITITKTESISREKSIIFAEGPLREIISGSFYDKLKGVTEGYASFSFNLIGFRKAKLTKVDILLAGRKEEAFSRIVPTDKAYQEGRKIVNRLKEALPAQQFELVIQAAVGGKIIARENIRARRKDVTAKLYGGDVTRKKKLLEKQKRGKIKLKNKAKIKIPTQVYLEVFKV